MGTEGQDTPGEPGAPVALHRPSCPLCPWGHWRPSPSGKDGKDKLCSRSGSVGLPSLPAHLSALCSPSPPHAPPTCRGRPSPRASPGRGLGLRSSMAPGSLPPPLPPTPSTLRPPRLDTALRDRRNDIGSFQTSQPGLQPLPAVAATSQCEDPTGITCRDGPPTCRHPVQQVRAQGGWGLPDIVPGPLPERS